MPSRRQVDLPEHVQEAARGRAVGGEADGDAALDQLRELPVRKRAIRALHARARAVHGRRVGVLEQVHLKVGEPRHVLLADAGAQMQQDRRDVRRPRIDGCANDLANLAVAVVLVEWV